MIGMKYRSTGESLAWMRIIHRRGLLFPPLAKRGWLLEVKIEGMLPRGQHPSSGRKLLYRLKRPWDLTVDLLLLSEALMGSKATHQYFDPRRIDGCVSGQSRVYVSVKSTRWTLFLGGWMEAGFDPNPSQIPSAGWQRRKAMQCDEIARLFVEARAVIAGPYD